MREEEFQRINEKLMNIFKIFAQQEFGNKLSMFALDGLVFAINKVLSEEVMKEESAK